MSTGTNVHFIRKHQTVLVFGFLLISALMIALITWWPLFSNQFVMWDDDFNIYENPILRAGSWLDFWANAYMGFYIPATYTVWFFVAKLFSQNDPLPFQILNLTFHFLNTILVFIWMRVLQERFMPLEKGEIRRLTPLYLVSILYLVHPLQVGAVAWNSGFRDLLSTTCTLICLLALFRFRGWKAWLVASIFFGLALLSKPASVYLPGMTLILALMMDQQRRKELIGWSLLHLGLAAAFVIVTRRIQSRFMIGLDGAPLLDRPFVIMDSYGFYVRQFFGGALSADYGRMPSRLMDWGLWIDTQPWLWGFLLFVALVFLKRFWRPALVFLALWLVPLSPTSGLVHFNFQRISTVADHYFQPAFPAFCFLFLFLFWRVRGQRWLRRGLTLVVLLGAITAAVKTYARIGSWRESEVLFHSMLEVNPYSHSANNYLGFFAYKRADWAAAEKFFRQATISQHHSAIATGNMAFAMIKQEKFQEAVNALEAPLQDPEFFRLNEVHRHVIAMNYLARTLALANLGRFAEARDAVCKALEYNPEPRDRNDALETLSRLQKELNPKNPEAEGCQRR